MAVNVVIALALGCTGGEPDSPTGAAVPLECRVLALSDLPDKEDLQLAMSIGAVEGDSVTTFGRISDLTVAPDGTLIVADEQRRAVDHLTRGGALVRRVARTGDGPGEVRYPKVLTLIDGNVLAVLDPALWRVSYHELDGEGVTTKQLRPEVEFGQSPSGGFDAGGRPFVLSFGSYQESLLGALDGARGLARGMVVVRRWHPEFDAWVDVVEMAGPEVYVDAEAGSIRDVRGGKEGLWGVRGDGTVMFADNAVYRIGMALDVGLAQCFAAVDLAPARLSEEERAEYYDATDVPPGDLNRALQVRARRRGTPLPRTRPAIDMLRVAESGSVWVRVTPDVPARPALAEWHVFEENGRPEARYGLPIDFAPKYIASDLVYGVRGSTNDVQLIEAYRLPR